MRVDHDIKHTSVSRLGSDSGFSVLELLVVIAIAGIVLTLAMPGYSSFMDREKVKAVAEDFSSTLTVVRSNAIKSGGSVFLCASSDSENCGDQWADGWLAFRDNNSDAELGTDDTILVRRDNGSGNIGVSVTSLAGDDVNVIGFNYRGAPDTAVAVELTRGARNYSMTVTPFGRTRHHD